MSTDRTTVAAGLHSTAAGAAASPAGPLPFPRIAGYTLVREISRGGQGVVFEALQEATGRSVAIKMLRAGSDAGAEERLRFSREIRLLAKLRHPHVVTIYDSGLTPEGDEYAVMELVRGQPLHQYVREHGLGLNETLHLVLDICSGLQAAHESGIIHRDIKPTNVLVVEERSAGGGAVAARSSALQQAGEEARSDPSPGGGGRGLQNEETRGIEPGLPGRSAPSSPATPGDAVNLSTIPPSFAIPKLLDFGLAKSLQTIDTRLTSSRDVLGTLPYMSPEQVRGGGSLDKRSDLYSLGVVLYELLTGRLPCPVSDQLPAMIQHITETEPTPLTRVQPSPLGVLWSPQGNRPVNGIGGGGSAGGGSEVSRSRLSDLDAIVQTCLQKQRERRYGSVAALSADLRAVLAGEPVSARRANALERTERRVMRVVRRQPAFAVVCAVVLGTLFGGVIQRWVFERWVPLDIWYVRGLMSWVSRHVPARPLSQVIVIEPDVRDGLEMQARSVGIADYRDDALRSGRLVFARLLAALAECNPRAVVVNMSQIPSPYDGPVVEALGLLRVRGVDVLSPTESWEPEEHNVSGPFSGLILAAPNTGAFKAEDTQFGFHVAVQRRGMGVLQSLVLRAVVAARHPGAEAEVQLDPDFPRLTLAYWRPTDASGRGRAWLGATDLLWFTEVVYKGKDWQTAGLGPDDTCASLIFPIPTSTSVEPAKFDTFHFLRCSQSDRARHVAGKVVVIGALSTHEAVAKSGRRVPSAWLLATGIDQLLNSASERSNVIAAPEQVLLGLSAGLGLVIGNRWFASFIRRQLPLVCLAIILLAASAMLAWIAQRLWSPIGVVVVAMVVSETTAHVRRRAISC